MNCNMLFYEQKLDVQQEKHAVFIRTVDTTLDRTIGNPAFKRLCKSDDFDAFWAEKLAEHKILGNKNGICLQPQEGIHPFDLLAGQRFYELFVSNHTNQRPKEAQKYFQEAIKCGNICAWWYQCRVNENNLKGVNVEKCKSSIQTIQDGMSLFNGCFIDTPGFLLLSKMYLSFVDFFVSHNQTEIAAQYLESSLKYFYKAKNASDESKASVSNVTCGRGIPHLLKMYTGDTCTWAQAEAFLTEKYKASFDKAKIDSIKQSAEASLSDSAASSSPWHQL